LSGNSETEFAAQVLRRGTAAYLLKGEVRLRLLGTPSEQLDSEPDLLVGQSDWVERPSD